MGPQYYQKFIQLYIYKRIMGNIILLLLAVYKKIYFGNLTYIAMGNQTSSIPDINDINWVIDQLKPPERGILKSDSKRIKSADSQKMRNIIKAYKYYFSAFYAHSYDLEKLEQYSLQIPHLKQMKYFFNQCGGIVEKFWKDKEEGAASFLTKILKYIKHLQIEQQKCTEKLHYFVHSNVLNKFQEERFLLATLEKYLGKKIVHIKEVYKFDQSNPTMLKNYIEGVANTITIIKCINGKKIGIFSSLSLFGKQKAGEKKGLVVDFTTSSWHPLIEGKKLVSSDPKKLIFGNEQLSLDKDKNTLNFYLKQSSFNVSWEQILGEKNQIQFESFQIYEILFKSEKSNDSANCFISEKRRQKIFSESDQDEKPGEHQIFHERIRFSCEQNKMPTSELEQKLLEDKQTQLKMIEEKIMQKQSFLLEIQQYIQESKYTLEKLVKTKIQKHKQLCKLENSIQLRNRIVEEMQKINHEMSQASNWKEKSNRAQLILKKVSDLVLLISQKKREKSNDEGENILKLYSEKEKQLQNRQRKLQVLEKQFQEKHLKSEKLWKQKLQELANRELEINKKQEFLFQSEEKTETRFKKSDIERVKQTKNEFEERKRKNFVLEKQIQEKRKKLENEMKEKSEQLERREVELNKRERQLYDLEKQISEKRKKLENEMKEKSEQLERREVELNKRERQLYDLEKQISEKRNKLENEMKEKSEQLERREVELNKWESLQGQLCGGNEFNGDIFYGFSEEKQYLVEELSKMNENRRIVGTKLLYSFPKFKECSFHPLVDGRKDYVVIILLQNQMKVAAYSKEVLQKGVENKGPGFLASLTNKQSFTLKKTQKAKLTVYNDFFFKFGNCQLVIKFCEQKMGPLRDEDFKVKSNFGQSNTNDFSCRKYKNQEILFGENARETGMLHYEVFQVEFDE